MQTHIWIKLRGTCNLVIYGFLQLKSASNSNLNSNFTRPSGGNSIFVKNSTFRMFKIIIASFQFAL